MTRNEQTARTLGARGTDYHGFLNFVNTVVGRPGVKGRHARFVELRAAYFAGRAEFEAGALATGSERAEALEAARERVHVARGMVNVAFATRRGTQPALDELDEAVAALRAVEAEAAKVCR